MARYAYHRLDANHAEIRAALEQAGATVESIGPLDLIAGHAGRTFLLEIKTAKGRVRPKQQRFLSRWKGHAAIVRTPEEAIAEVFR